MSADLAFLEELLLGLDLATLDWLEVWIARRKAPEIIVRKTIIRKED